MRSTGLKSINSLMKKIEVKGEDIFNSEAECLVNAGNKNLTMGRSAGGLSGIFHGKVGYNNGDSIFVRELLNQNKEWNSLKKVAVADLSKVQDSGLKKFVIHAVGPNNQPSSNQKGYIDILIEQGKTEEAIEELKSVYDEVFKTAHKNGIRKIAVPAISVGIFCYPKDLAKKAIARSIKEHHENFEKIEVCYLESKDINAQNRFVEEMRKEIREELAKTLPPFAYNELFSLFDQKKITDDQITKSLKSKIEEASTIYSNFDINFCQNIGHENPTLLYLAVRNGYANCVKMLLEKGADSTIVNRYQDNFETQRISLPHDSFRGERDKFYLNLGDKVDELIEEDLKNLSSDELKKLLEEISAKSRNKQSVNLTLRGWQELNEDEKVKLTDYKFRILESEGAISTFIENNFERFTPEQQKKINDFKQLDQLLKQDAQDRLEEYQVQTKNGNSSKIQPEEKRPPVYFLNPETFFPADKDGGARILHYKRGGEQDCGSYKYIKKIAEGLPKNVISFNDNTYEISCYAGVAQIKNTPALKSVFRELGYRETGKSFSSMQSFFSNSDAHKELLKKLSPKNSTSERNFVSEANEFFKNQQEKPDRESINNLTQLLDKSFCVGEGHSDIAPKRFLIENMKYLKDRGYQTLFMEHLLYDSAMQDSLDDYFKGSGEMTKDLQEYLDALDSGFDPLEQSLKKDGNSYNFLELVKSAKENGIRIVGIDTNESYLMGLSEFGATGPERMKGMNFAAQEIIKKEEGGKKWIALMGNGHLGTTDGIIGVAELLGVPALDVYSNEKSQETDVKFNHPREVVENGKKITIFSDIVVKCANDQSLVIENLAPKFSPVVETKNEEPIIAKTNKKEDKRETQTPQFSEIKVKFEENKKVDGRTYYKSSFEGENAENLKLENGKNSIGPENFSFATNATKIEDPKEAYKNAFVSVMSEIIEEMSQWESNKGKDNRFSSNCDRAQFVALVALIAVKNGGVGSNEQSRKAFKEDLEKVLGNKFDEKNDIADGIKISGLFQNKMKSRGYTTGREDALGDKAYLGARLKRAATSENLIALLEQFNAHEVFKKSPQKIIDDYSNLIGLTPSSEVMNSSASQIDLTLNKYQNR